ncbi:hypothetical protein OO013_16055 [Mangrovivirga sp. M17]|uniref:Uncharacterized protein n=1 Tax=Mangrovivirga halotolerans TaxID=2993936 RepID=A0ABT3RVL5_9BACT|nr:hypothetical protein [Mangrovivirga halotolerans]MCX2745393.1 hypothetical protein [Mangrovivirga halotolerans]
MFRKYFLPDKISLFLKGFLFVLLLVPFTMAGQGEAEYSGPFSVSGYTGIAEFKYQIEEGDTILTGPFELSQIDPRSLIQEEDDYFLFKGGFKNDLPDGYWKFVFGEFGTNNNAEFEDNAYRVKLDGIIHRASGSLNNGKPNGKWTHKIEELDNSEIERVLFNSSINFEYGVPQRSFNIENERLTLIGRFLRDGLAHDVWELYSSDALGATENWYFQDGRLEQIIIQQDNNTRTLKGFPRKMQNPKVINLDERFIKILQLRQQLINKGDTVLNDSQMGNLLAENASNYKKIDDILSNLGKSSFMPEFKVKAEYFPLTDNEKELLDDIQEYVIKSEEINQFFIESSQLKILQLSDDDVAFLVAATKGINSNYLSLVKDVVRYEESDILEFVPRNEFKGEENYSSEFEVNYQGQDEGLSGTFLGPQNRQFNFNKDGLELVAEVAEYSYFSLEHIKDQLSNKLTERQQEQKLANLEEELIMGLNAANEATDSLSSILEGPEKQAVLSIKEKVNSDLKNYSSIEDPNVKIDRARELITCFSDLTKLSLTIGNLPARAQEIKEEYTEEVFNPFTATLMDEEVKKRITNAYNEVLIPHFLKKVQSDLTCENTEEINDLLNKSYLRVLELKEEDTSRIERKLKKEKDPQEVLQMLNIQAVNNEIDG